MGQARRRGTYEQRKLEGIEKRMAAEAEQQALRERRLLAIRARRKRFNKKTWEMAALMAATGAFQL